MRAKIIDFLYITPQRQRLTIDVYDDFSGTYDKVKDSEIDLTVKKKSKKRSLDANAYMWVLLDRLATATGIPVKDLYFDGLKNVGGNVEFYCGKSEAIERMCALWEAQGTTGWGWPYERYIHSKQGYENVKLFYGSSTFDKPTMSRMIDNLVQDCKACGVETMTPEELESLLGGY